MVSKALVVGAYQRKAEVLARLGASHGLELTVLVPPAWRDRRGVQQAEYRHTAGYTLRTIPLRFNGNFHLHYYPTLARELQTIQPHILHMDEEPYNLATWLGLRAAEPVGAVSTFFTWQNIYRQYPPPFRWLEQQNYRRAPLAIAGNRDAKAVLQRKGFRGEIRVIPQFGVDPVHFSPITVTQPRREFCHIGYAGGLLTEKGVDLLLQACARLNGAWKLSIAGEGAEQNALQALAATLGIAERVQWVGKIDSEAMVAFYQSLDLFVLPSRTQPNWKEQFGRVLIEAMACAICVIGTDSGEIPHVLGEAGAIVPEDDVEGLRQQLQRLLDDSTQRDQLGAAGRTRVLHNYTMASIAEATLHCYEWLYSQCK